MDPLLVITLGLAAVSIVVGAIAIRNGRAYNRSLAVIRRLRASAAQHDEEVARGGAEQAGLLQALDSGVLRVDGGLRVVVANPAAHRLLGRPPGTLPGRSVMEAFLDAGIESMAQTALGQGTARAELRRADADGP
ncbi:MAG: fold, partial [Chloroflexota bacterium]|nr:fold [Chloroflexota bacterium]